MRRFIVRNHRDRKKLTLTAARSEKVSVSITLTLGGRRVLELSDKVCARYAASLAEYVKQGALAPLGDAPSPGPDLTENEVHADELDLDPEQDEDDAEA